MATYNTREEIIKAACAGEISPDQAVQLCQEMDEKEKQKKLSWKMTEKGTISVYGLRKFPATFWPNEWLSIAGILPQIVTYIKNNEKAIAAIVAANKEAA